ncbi:potassium channel family protein [Streptomyces sp. SCSIO 75703]|uniref:potassium channel family protein n=2 Tax=Streptomyces TaxID=1883 RepID=UPI000ADDC0B6|nr:potassium channel family protein [Streptomyces sp. NRRL F-5065]
MTRHHRAVPPDGGGDTGPDAGTPAWRGSLAWLLCAAAGVGMVVAYFLAPLDQLGPRRPALSWALFAGALCVVAGLLLREIRNVLVDRPRTRPGVMITLLILVTVHVFSTAYYALAKEPGQFAGDLRTRLDALYFTIVTLATVGYGDIAPSGQTSRTVAVIQILYSFVFLTAAATALTQRMRRVLERRAERDQGG